MEIDAIQQGTGDASLVAPDLIGGATTGPDGIAQVATRAGIHGGHALDASGELCLLGSTRNGDDAGFQRLAQYFKHGTIELGQLVEKQHAGVGQGDFTGPGWIAAAHQGDG